MSVAATSPEVPCGDVIFVEIAYPSGKLHSMTRKRNQIKQYLTHKSAENKKIVACYLDELCIKKDHFVAACNEQ